MTIKDLYNWAKEYNMEDARIELAFDDYRSGVELYYPNEDSLDYIHSTEGDAVRIYF